MMIPDPQALFLAQRFILRQLQLLPYHFSNQLRKCCSWHPAELFSCLRGISQQGIYFRRPKVVRVHGNDTGSSLGIQSFLTDTRPRPPDTDAQLAGDRTDKTAHGMLLL